MRNLKINALYVLGLVFIVLPYMPWLAYITSSVLLLLYLFLQGAALFVPQKVYISPVVGVGTYSTGVELSLDIVARLMQVIIMAYFGFYLMAGMQFAAHILFLNLYRNSVNYLKPRVH
jgi:hypothetical protein